MSGPYYSDDLVTVHLGDCLDVLAGMESGSIDAVVTDPPYALAELPLPVIVEVLSAWLGGDRAYVPKTGAGFMGRDWDRFVPPPAAWDQCMRVLKPGGHVLAFAAPRTQDLMAMSVRLAGFEIRDGLKWIFGQGYPKSLDVSKAIDKAGGVDAAAFKEFLAGCVEQSGLRRAAIDARCGFTMRFDTPYGADPVGWGVSLPSPEKWLVIKEVLSIGPVRWDALIDRVWRGRAGEAISGNDAMSGANFARSSKGDPVHPDAARWEGWGTALKPSHEPIVMARKPLAGTVAANVLGHGTGAINVKGCQVGSETRVNNAGGGSSLQRVSRVEQGYRPTVTASRGEPSEVAGRWPPNVLLSEEAAEEMDRQSGVLTSGANPARRAADKLRDAYGEFTGQAECAVHRGADSGGASRFFPVFRYEAKADAYERHRLPDGTAHNTVKPVALMRWLVRLVTPPGGLVLDPFAGSGTTGEACIIEGFRSVLVERDPKYAELIMTRLRKPIQPDLFGGAA